MSITYKQARRRFRALAKTLGLNVSRNVARGQVGRWEGFNRAHLELELLDSGEVTGEVWRFLGDPLYRRWKSVPLESQVKSMVEDADTSAILAVP